jgi:hypothetical protein
VSVVGKSDSGSEDIVGKVSDVGNESDVGSSESGDE